MNSLESDFQKIRRRFYLISSSNLFFGALLCVFWWALWSNLIPVATDAFSRSVALTYCGFLAIYSIVVCPVQTILIGKRLSEAYELAKRKKYTESYLLRSITLPLLGSAGWIARRDADGRPVEGTATLWLGFSTQDGGQNWPEAAKNRPICEITAVAAVAVLDGKQQEIIIMDEHHTYVIVYSWPKALMPLFNSFEAAIYGKERSGKW